MVSGVAGRWQSTKFARDARSRSMAIRDLIDRFVLKWKAEGLASALHSSKLVILRPLYSRMESSFNHPEQYEAVPVAAFRSLLSILPKNLSDYIFIDYGSGKGIAVLLASERNFKAIIGIEYSPELYALAQSNVSRFLNRSGRNCRISLINEDAVNYAIPEDDCVLFFYNPFLATLWQASFGRSSARTGRTRETCS